METGRGGTSPFRTPAFRAFWVAGLFSDLGSWIHLVAAAWMMTSLTKAVVFAIAMAAGAACLGYVAGRFGLVTTLVVAAAGMLANILLARWLRPSVADAIDTSVCSIPHKTRH